MTTIQTVQALPLTPRVPAEALPAAVLPVRRRPSAEVVSSWRSRQAVTTPGMALGLGNAMADDRARSTAGDNVHVGRGVAAASGVRSYDAKHVQGSPPRGRPV